MSFDFRAWAPAVSLALACLPAAARAAPEEIQVYMDEMNARGKFGLDVHTNYVASGDFTPSYPGEQSNVHRFRVTPEFSYGLTPDLELGAYLPLTTLDNRGRFTVSGEKVRIKYIFPKAEGQTWFAGANFELGRVQHRLDVNPWNAELKMIFGFRSGPWTVAFNGNTDFTVSGPQPGPVSFDVDTKISYAFGKAVSLGLESYNGIGDSRHLGDFGNNDQTLFATADTSIGKWDLNLGVGRGYGANPDRWILKAIIGVPIDD
ncbi:MAG TPA: hypothetical protein VL358_00665 [Caulobacteraceae bacterium]|jgi:hypothetical protein|nr:hypothetical protein [Caulobacteraceae bacterium]